MGGQINSIFSPCLNTLLDTGEVQCLTKTENFLQCENIFSWQSIIKLLVISCNDEILSLYSTCKVVKY